MPKWMFNDGGRKAAGYKGKTGDCVCRSIAIALQLPYEQVYDELIEIGRTERITRTKNKKSHPRTGMFKRTIRRYLEAKGWTWNPTMFVGSGCKVHLKAEELPKGRLVVACSKHYTAVVDGLIHDIYDPSRDGTRCVYGYFAEKEERSDEAGN